MAQTFTAGDLNYQVNPDGVSVTVTGHALDYEHANGPLNIPESVSYEGVDYAVTNIGDAAFLYYFYLTSLSLPNSLLTIGNSAFAYCSGFIGDYAFRKCGGFTKAVSEVGNVAATVYPNPTKGAVKIDAEGIKNISVYNSLGQVIFENAASGDTFEYDFSGNEAGLYFIKVETTNGVETKRVTVL